MRNPPEHTPLLKKPIVVYPFLFAVFPVLFLYAHNVSQTSVSQIWIPMAASILLALVLLVVLRLALKDMLKAGLSSLVFLFLFFSYGRLYELLERWAVFVPSHWYLVAAFLLVWAYCTYLISRSKWNFKNATNLLNVVAVVLVLINVFSVAVYEIQRPELTPADRQKVESSPVATTEQSGLANLPDIYYIILDEYARADVMLQRYNYDSSQFLKDLGQIGFFVADKSETPTPETYESMASSLNMSYDYVTKPQEAVYQSIVDNDVSRFLRSKGYEYVYFGNWYEIGRWKVVADSYYNFYAGANYSSLATEFSDAFWQTTMLRPFARSIMASQYDNYYRSNLLSVLQHLRQMPRINDPKFVFCHLMCPHPPFVFGPNGEHVDSADWYNFDDKKFYLGQYIFTNNEIENTVRYILKQSLTEPIIILQSDHGLRIRWWQKNPEVGAADWRKILNAYYLPGDVKGLLWDSISPVNTFRVIFNHYFNTDYPILEDYNNIYPDTSVVSGN